LTSTADLPPASAWLSPISCFGENKKSFNSVNSVPSPYSVKDVPRSMLTETLQDDFFTQRVRILPDQKVKILGRKNERKADRNGIEAGF